MDWIRLLLMVQEIIVVGLYLLSCVRMVQAIRCHPHAPRDVVRIAWGRTLRCTAIILFCASGIEGSIELWNAEVTPRVLWTELALLAAATGWALVERSFRDDNIFHVRQGDC